MAIIKTSLIVGLFNELLIGRVWYCELKFISQ